VIPTPFFYLHFNAEKINKFMRGNMKTSVFVTSFLMALSGSIAQADEG